MKSKILLLVSGLLLTSFSAHAELAIEDFNCAELTYKDIEPHVATMTSKELREISSICRAQGELFLDRAAKAFTYDESVSQHGAARSAFGLATSLNLEVAARPFRRWL